MGKSVYSFVLSDDIIQAIDEKGMQNGYSRSALVNKVLAEYAQLPTSEERIEEIFQGMLQAFEADQYLTGSLSSGGKVFLLQSTLCYKYKPTISYRVNLFHEQVDEIGILKISLRSQNTQLIENMARFTNFWALLEKQYLPSTPKNNLYSVSNPKYTRTLRYPSKVALSENETALLIEKYIRLFNDSLKLFFNDTTSDTSKMMIEKNYCQTINTLEKIKYI